MKKESRIINSILFFLAAVITLLFCFLQFRNNYALAAGTGVLVIIAAYFVLNGLASAYIEKKKEEKESFQKEFEKKYKEVVAAADERLASLEQLQKAVYIATKNNSKTLEEGFREEMASRELMAKQLMEADSGSAKMIIKYSREDAKNLAVVQKKIGDQTLETLTDGLKELKDELQKLESLNARQSSGDPNMVNSDITVITECINRNFDLIKIKIEGGFELVESNLSEIRDELIEFKEGAAQTSMLASAAAALQPMAKPEPMMHPAGAELMAQTMAEAEPMMQTMAEPERMMQTMTEAELILQPLEEPGLGTVIDEQAERIPELQPEVELEPIKAELPHVETPKVETSRVETPKAETSKVETSRAETPKVEAYKVKTPKVEAPKVEAPKVEAPKVETPKVEAPKVEAPRMNSNQKLNQDDIAAMIAAMNGEAAAAEEKPEAAIPMSSLPEPAAANPANANKQLSADEIAALFSSMGN